MVVLGFRRRVYVRTLHADCPVQHIHLTQLHLNSTGNGNKHDMPSRSHYNPPSSATGGRRSGGSDAERVADAAAVRVAQLHDENDHVHCSEGNRVLLRQQALDTLRVTLTAEIAEDDWMYDEDPLVTAASASLSSAAGGSGPLSSGVGGASGRGDAGGADRAAVTAMYLERVAEQRASAMARSRAGLNAGGGR